MAEPLTAGARRGWAPSQRLPVPPSSAVRPATLPGYEILGELGRGGMGVVYRARQVRLNRVVASEDDPRRRSRRSAEAAIRFRGEAEAVARLQHPHIVQVLRRRRLRRPPVLRDGVRRRGQPGRPPRRHPGPAREAARLIETLPAPSTRCMAWGSSTATSSRPTSC